jgi:endonuclease/exonuclease/phosphatase family metal-dependent hydrolase
MKIKVMQYNVLTGFRKLEEPYNLEGNRLELAKKIISKENPDILLLNEAYFETKNDSGILMDYQKLFGFKYYVHGNYIGGLSPFWGCVVLSKYPILESENKNKNKRGHFSCKIKLNEKELNLDLIHLAPAPFSSSEEQKIDIQEILKKKKKNYILSGDFNSLSPLDEYEKERMISSWKKFTEDAEAILNEMLKKKAVEEVLAHGLIDTYREKNNNFDFTIPTDFLSKDKNSGTRIDYIFCSKDFKVLKSGIIKNKFSEQASDHYLTYAVLELK